jgi:hypothetical protein
MSQPDSLNERIDLVLGAMAAVGPRDLRAWLRQPGPDLPAATEEDINGMVNALLSEDPNTPARVRFSGLLRSWDNVKVGGWIDETPRNTAARRRRIHELLRSPPHFESRVDAQIPFYPIEEPIVIAQAHRDWYTPRPGVKDYYWSTYQRYLSEQRGWQEDSLLSLDNTTRAIVECLADPEWTQAYASRGLVMGYVQSGKTTNFMGVAARAADAGYRLCIVLAGTWNILRNQTQRRFDKELLGKELLGNDESYTLQPPSDWHEFLEHGADPSTLGHYTWQRLTRPDIDFRRLKAAIDNLEFEKRDKAAALFSPINLHALPAKLLVVKKHSSILANLVKDLKLIRTRLTDLPTLIIDDESDQAGLNTIDPKRAKRRQASAKERSRTNQRITELLDLFPRGQYIGYTATPYANALVDPDDPQDLFPKDFIVSLDRPRGYMGVSDFFDPQANFEDLSKDDWSEAEIAFIRRVENPLGKDDEDLKKALRSYVLSGAVKLYRSGQDPVRYKDAYFRHHTMLIHTSQLRGEHTSLAERLKRLWDQCAMNSPKGLTDLETIWKGDYEPVCGAQGSELSPESFDVLLPYLSGAIKRIEHGQNVFLVVNSDSPDAPDFSAAPVWKIVIGGNKLSRGYTIEGLTVSYYRRVAGAADTLMQMGRWFGFRPGYRDLVRVFLGVKDGRRGDTDLVALFKEVCRMEESFREEIKRYARTPGARHITPKEIPPLISVTGTLPPTAGNKMFNAKVTGKNFAAQTSMLTLTPIKPQRNVTTGTTLLLASKSIGRSTLGGVSADGGAIAADSLLYEATNADVVAFLKQFRWLESEYKFPERPAETTLQIEFLEQQKHGITSWLIMAPQRKVSFGATLTIEGVGKFAVKKRRRLAGRGFQVFGEPDHRSIARKLAGLKSDKNDLVSPNAATQAQQDKHRGVLLFYVVREQENDAVSIGFELVFPDNDLPRDINFTVRREAESSSVVVGAAEDD